VIITPRPTAEEAAAIAAALAQLGAGGTDLKVRGYKSKWSRPGLKPRHYIQFDWKKTARREAVEPDV